VKVVDGFNSFITFTDDFSRYGYIYPIREQSKAVDKFKIEKPSGHLLGFIMMIHWLGEV
jgi:hypothetical protein